MSDFLRSLLATRGFYVSRVTRAAKIAELIEQLKPVHSGKDLIRIGPKSDGGYLVPDDLDGVSTCFSPGVSDECGFDLQMAQRGMDVHLIDKSVDGPSAEHRKFTFVRKFLDTYDDDESGLITLDSLCRGSAAWGPGADFILQMDIESAEYRVIHSISNELLKRFRIIIVEFHQMKEMLNRKAFEDMKAAFSKLLKHHRVVHIHPNNGSRSVRLGRLEIPDLMEFTFYRSDRFIRENRPLEFPHELDCDNVPGNPSLVLPVCWR